MIILKGKKILVAGGEGFIGSRTVTALREAGADVVTIDIDHQDRTACMIGNGPMYRFNISDVFVLEETFQKEKPDIVYNFAFNVSAHKNFDLDDSWESVKGGLNLLGCCRKYNVQKFIFSSSGMVYGNTEVIPTKEIEPINPNSPHSISKSALESYIKFFHRAYGLHYVILRYPTVYGPGQRTGAMSDYITALSAGRQADIWGDGNKTRDYIYIDDVVRANLSVLELPDDFESPIFNVSTAKEISLHDLYFKIAKLLGKEAKPNYLPERPGELMRYCLDYSKIKNVLGWEPQYSFEEGLEKRLKEEHLI